MSTFGIRSRLKQGVKRVLGITPDADTQPPNWQSRPPTEDAYVPPAPAPAPVAAAPAPVAAPPTPEVVPAPAPVATPEPTLAAAAAEAAAELSAEDVVGDALTVEAVQEILDEMVRPALQGDGGDISLIKVEDNNVYVKLVGACSTCPSSIMTMKLGVEALLKEEFPAMRELIDVGATAAP